MKITEILILRPQKGSDKVIFHTDLPSAVWPFEGFQDLNCDVARFKGEEFCAQNFPNIPFKLKLI